jgi:uncharacterized surface protein with fasciclin (FAS1) repeats
MTPVLFNIMSLLVNIIYLMMFRDAMLNQLNKTKLMKKIFTLLTASFMTLAVNAQTVVDIIVNSPDHNTLEAAVIAANLQGTLSGPGPFTVFAPTDAAFAALPAGTVTALLADIPALTNILTYHAVGASALSSSLTNGQMVTTLQGQKVTVTINSGNVFINNAQVTVADIVATNGVVHVIDAVLLPPTGTVVDVVVNSPNHTTLEAAVIAAGLAGTLSGTGPFTVFAPTDAAFAALPAGTVDALLADIPALTNILTYHAVAGSAFSAGLNNGQMITTVQGQKVTVTINNGNVFINNTQVTVADIVATNGVVHVIDAVLLPPTGTVVDVIVNSPNHTILEAAVIAAGLDGTLSGTGPFTIFAPTDAAFEALPSGTVEALLADIPALTNILTYHAVAGSAFSAGLNNGQMIMTVQGQDVTVTFNNGNVFINDAQVTVADIVATNGVVHVIDAVLIPAAVSNGTVVDIIVNSADHTTLEAAVIAAGLAGTLSGTGPFTVFAPTDAAFAALPAGTVAALLADIPALTNILTYHAVAGTALSSDLSNGQMIMTIQGQDVTVTIDNGNVFINNAQVTVADIIATNGVVHVIDAVLLPEPTVSNGTVVDIIVNSPEHTTLETAVIAAGLAGTLSGTGPFTVFAPTDAAFAAVPTATLNALLADPNGLLTDVLLHHVVGATALSTDLSNGQQVTTLFGDNLLIGINNGVVSIDNATVIVADIEATNGVVHVIDAVLVPLTLGLDNINNSTIGVYPNPVSDVLRFNLGQTTTNATYQVFNQTGALVLSGKFNSNASTLSVEDLQSGLYTVSVLENNKMNSIRFVKN